MTTALPMDQHRQIVAAAANDLAERAQRAGLDADVPTCPRWTVADLVAHQGIVHRWATSHLLGAEEYRVSKKAVLTDIAPAELVAWLRHGADALLEAVRNAPADLRAMVFLKDPPPPREFWARRQAHETTIHSVDALAALLGRVPTAAEAGIGPDAAMDGLDEVVRGFVPRGRSKLTARSGTTLAVVPDDGEAGWYLRLGERIEAERVGRDDPRALAADATFSGTAAELYLGLWNRGSEVRTTDADLLADWHRSQRVRWS